MLQLPSWVVFYMKFRIILFCARVLSRASTRSIWCVAGFVQAKQSMKYDVPAEELWFYGSIIGHQIYETVHVLPEVLPVIIEHSA